MNRSVLSKANLFLIGTTLLVAMLVLVGWMTGNTVLTSVLPQFNPMNPMTATCFVFISLGLFFGNLTQIKGKKIYIIVAGVFVALVGAIMLLKYAFGIDLQIDRILFESKLGINRMAPTSSLNFVLIGVCLLLGLRWVKTMRLIALVVSGVSVYALLAYLYNFVGVYGSSVYNPMALHTALLFLLISLYLLWQGGIWDGRTTDMLRQRRLYIPTVMISVFLLTLIPAIGIAYLVRINVEDQSRARFENHTDQISSFIESRMNLYTGIVYGVQGLFAASENVEEDEWQKYFEALDVPKRYPGISGVSFVKKVPRAEVSKFPYPIYPQSDKAEYYPLTYITSFTPGTTTTASLGFDYSSSPERYGTLQTSIQKDEELLTPIVIGVTTKTPLFSVYAPIYQNRIMHETAEAREAAAQGVVAISFRLENIFSDLTLNPLFNEDVDVQIYDVATIATASSQNELYHTSKGLVGDPRSDFSKVATIMVANRPWIITYTSQSRLNLPVIARSAPEAAMAAGIIFCLFISIFVGMYIRSRERTIATKNAQLGALVLNFPYGIAIEDANGKITLVNQKLLDVFKLDANAGQGVIGQTTESGIELLKTFFKDPDVLLARIRTIVSEKKVVADEKLVLQNDTYLLRSYVPLIYGNEYHGGVWIFKDVTEEQKIDKMKTEFVSLASHQLRTPLTFINWYSELLLDKTTGTLNENQTSYTQEIHDASVRMVGLVNSLLNVSRLELGTFTVEPVETDILTILDVVVREQSVSFKEKKQTFKFVHPDTLPRIKVDHQLMHIIVQNLLSNASKYTPEKGTIELSIQIEGSGPDGFMVISCKDNGLGIPKAQQGSIFKKLFRADNVRTSDVEGTGLGLYIVKSIVEASGSSITFTSEEKRGTTFVVKIPLSGMTEKKGTRTLSHDMSGSATIKLK